VLDFLRIAYEEGTGRLETPEYAANKLRAKQEAPVAKTHEKKNFKGIQQSEEVAKVIVRTSLKNQSEALKERLQQRKLQIFRRRQTVRQTAGGRAGNKTIDGGRQQRLDSPNMSRSKCPLSLAHTLVAASLSE